MVAWVVHKQLSDSDDPQKTALELGRAFTQITRSNLKNE